MAEEEITPTPAGPEAGPGGIARSQYITIQSAVESLIRGKKVLKFNTNAVLIHASSIVGLVILEYIPDLVYGEELILSAPADSPLGDGPSRANYARVFMADGSSYIVGAGGIQSVLRRVMLSGIETYVDAVTAGKAKLKYGPPARLATVSNGFLPEEVIFSIHLPISIETYPNQVISSPDSKMTYYVVKLATGKKIIIDAKGRDVILGDR